jgi:hypothetical protein
MVSHSLVEPMLIDTPAKDGRPARMAVTLVNWANAPRPSIHVEIRGVDRATAVRSVERGPVPFRIENGSLIVDRFPLDAADMLLIDR